ncbi:hypothetical protein VU04_04225 [Desulfobulbus sp. TB]|nr:hypothetical protein [Desulfobulbus sp. TB]
MSGFKSMTITSALLLSVSTFALSVLSVPTAFAVEISAGTGKSVMGELAVSPAIKSMMIEKRAQILAKKIKAKPLLNDMMPEIQNVMMPAMKEKILPEKMAVLENKMAQKIAPNFK